MKADEADLQVLLHRTFAGDQSAYRELLTQLQLLLQKYVKKQLVQAGRTDHERDDIVQEALFAIHNRWSTYDRALPLTSWAYAIARYKLIDYLRKSNENARMLSLAEIEPTPASDSYATDTAITLGRLVAMLPSNLRQSIELVRVRGLSIKEASIALGMPEGSIKANIHRGIKKMTEDFRKD
jgi:RNA polymerase sigma-70 factor, ECF subfamily